MVQFRFAPQMWATRPHLGSIFEKLLHRKTFSLPAALSLQPRLSYFDVMFHVKHSEIAPRETTRNRFGKAGAHPQLALGIAIAPKTLYLITSFWFWRQLRFFRFSLRFLLQFHCAVRFASQMWATRPHLGSIFEKLLHRKTFCLPAARILQPNFYVAFMSCNVSRETLLLGKPLESGSARLGHIPSLP